MGAFFVYLPKIIKLEKAVKVSNFYGSLQLILRLSVFLCNDMFLLYYKLSLVRKLLF